MDKLIKKENQQIQQFNPIEHWEKLAVFSKRILQSGFLPEQYKTPEQVAAVLLHAQELHIPFMQAINGGLFPIGRKVGMSISTMVGLVKNSKQLADLKITYDYEKKNCTVYAKHINGQEFTTIWGHEDAVLAGLLGKENYKKYEKLMWQWRAIGNNFRILFADIIGGYHTPEELGAEVRVVEDGEVEVINAPVVEATIDMIDKPDSKYETIWKALIDLEKSKKYSTIDDFFNWYELWYEDICKLSEKKRNLLAEEFKSQLISRKMTKEQINARITELIGELVSNKGTARPADTSITGANGKDDGATTEGKSTSDSERKTENGEHGITTTGGLTIQSDKNNKSDGIQEILPK